jgi:hypothetical protein
MSKNKYLSVEIQNISNTEIDPLHNLSPKPIRIESIIPTVDLRSFRWELTTDIPECSGLDMQDKASWQSKNLTDLRFKSNLDFSYQTQCIIDHYKKHKDGKSKNPKINYKDPKEYEIAAKDFAQKFFQPLSDNLLIIPQVNKNTNHLTLTLYEIGGLNHRMVIEKQSLTSWRFCTFHRHSTIHKSVEKNLTSHLNLMIKCHGELRTCGMFQNEATQKKIINRIITAKMLRSQIAKDNLDPTFQDRIIAARGSLDNIK